MSKVNEEIISILGGLLDDSEKYHAKFDDMLEEKLRELDPEWMLEMAKLYEKSGCGRWCA